MDKFLQLKFRAQSGPLKYSNVEFKYVHTNLNLNLPYPPTPRAVIGGRKTLGAQHHISRVPSTLVGVWLTVFNCCWISQAVLFGHQDTVPLLGVAAGVRGRVRGRRVRVVVAVLVEVPGPLQGHKVISVLAGGQRSHAWLATCLAGCNCLWTLYSALASHYYPTQQSIGLSECFSHLYRERERHRFTPGLETGFFN